MKVLVLHASALHLGFLGCYGNTWIATPNVDRLAAEGVVFDRHIADNLCSCTCRTGRLSWPLEANSLLANPQNPLEFLQSFLGDCVAVNGLDFSAAPDATPLERTLDAAVSALYTLADKPRWLCWVDLPSLYPPWDVADEFTSPYLGEEKGDEDDEPFEPLPDPPVGPFDRDDLVSWERVRCTYGGAVTYLDAGLGLLFDQLKKDDLFHDLIVIFTAHRGLALAEHGIVGDWLPWLHEELVHVPLIVRQSGGADPGRRVLALTQPVDLFATLLDLFGIAASPLHGLDGRSWLPLLRGQKDVIRQHSVSAWKLGDAEEWALRTSQHALLVPITQPAHLQPRQVQLYLKPEDRWEANNVIQHHLELADDLEQTLRHCCSSTSAAISGFAPPSQSSR